MKPTTKGQLMSDEFSYFDLGSGLPLADAVVHVTAAEFRFDTDYSADAVVCAIKMQPLDEEGVEEQEQLYSVGKGWEPLDSGASVGHGSGKRVKINNQSNYGRWIAAAVQCEGFLDEARERGLEPDSAELWVDLIFRLTTVEYETRNPSKPTEPAKMRTAVVPGEYLGTTETYEGDADITPPADLGSKPAGKAVAKKVAGKKVAAKKAPAKAAGASTSDAQAAAIAELEQEEGGEDFVATLRTLAAEAEDHESFMEAAFEYEAPGDGKLAGKVIMSSKPGSVWADRES